MLLPVLVVVAVVVAAHLPAVGPALRGTAFPGAPLDDADTLYSLRLADDAWRWFVAAAQTGPLGWLGGLVYAPIRARTLNGLDLVLAVWPARGLAGGIGAAPALTTLHVGLVAAAAGSGVLYARALGAGGVGAAAGGLVAGTSGMVLTVVGIGQYPQALVALPFCWFAGFVRVWRGERGGVPLAIVGGAGSLLLYWLYVPILALGTAALALGAWMVR